jgi:hypothetical protein
VYERRRIVSVYAAARLNGVTPMSQCGIGAPSRWRPPAVAAAHDTTAPRSNATATENARITELGLELVLSFTKAFRNEDGAAAAKRVENNISLIGAVLDGIGDKDNRSHLAINRDRLDVFWIFAMDAVDRLNT